MIRLESASKVFDLGSHQVVALDHVDEQIEDGEHVAIMGPSGSGKSTLLNLIGCLDRPTSGRLFLDDQDVSRLSEDELSRIRQSTLGFVFQSFHLVPRLSALANVELPMLFAGTGESERRAVAEKALREVGLLDRAHHRPAQLSGGECQRVAIARACVLDPRILLADEPTGNLDTRAGSQVLDILDERHERGMTVLVVTHDPHVARRADRILILADGKILRRLPGSAATDIAALFEGLPGASGTP